MDDKEKKHIDVLLNEYQACHSIQNHYDNIRWTIGSIFIATSLALFGISFWEVVRIDFWEVTLIAGFSIALILIWYAYNQHVNPYVMGSIKRCHEIELKLFQMGFNVTLHKSIVEGRQILKGINITYFLFLTVFSAWIIRIIISWKNNIDEIGAYGLIPIIVFGVIAIIVIGLHYKRFNITNWGEEYRSIISERKITSKKTTPSKPSGESKENSFSL
jgi:hypothetical protein